MEKMLGKFVYSVNDSRKYHTSIHLWGGRCWQNIAADKTFIPIMITIWKTYPLPLRYNFLGTVNPKGIIFVQRRQK